MRHAHTNARERTHTHTRTHTHAHIHRERTRTRPQPSLLARRHLDAQRSPEQPRGERPRAAQRPRTPRAAAPQTHTPRALLCAAAHTRTHRSPTHTQAQRESDRPAHGPVRHVTEGKVTAGGRCGVGGGMARREGGEGRWGRRNGEGGGVGAARVTATYNQQLCIGLAGAELRLVSGRQPRASYS